MIPRFQLAAPLKCPASLISIDVGSDDRTAVAVCDKKLFKIDLQKGSFQHVCDLTQLASEVCINAVHQLGAATTGTEVVDVYDLRTGERKQRLRRDGAPGFLSTVPANHIALDPAGKMMVVTTTGSRILVHDAESGDWEHIMFVKYRGCDVTISPDGKYVAIFGAPNGSELSGHLTMYLVRKGLQPLWTQWHESDQPVTDVNFSPNGRFVVSCGPSDGARVWDIQTGKLQFHRKSTGDQGFRNAWCFDKQDHLATLDTDLAICKLGESDSIFRQLVEAFSISTVSPTGRSLLLAGDDAMLNVWNINHSK